MLPKELPGDDGAAGTETDAKTDGELGERERRLDTAQRDLSTELTDDIGVDEGVGLLEEGAEEERHAQREQLPPDHALCDVD